MPSWRFVAAAAALAAYALLSHLLMTHAPDRPWSVAALFAPVLVALGVAGWRRRHGLSLAACALLAAALVTVVVRGGGVDVNRLYVLQHATVHAALAWFFGMTLRDGATPLITALAERVHEHFTPAMRDYTRWLTGLWVAYFVGMIAVSALVYALAPWSWWSLFCNLLTPLAAVGLFVGEHLVRHWRHPEFERVSLGRAVRAYREFSAARGGAAAQR